MTFGDKLRREREARGLTVEAVASQTKIPPRHLVALERGDALPLPAFYQRAEVRAVARALGLDEELASARLQAELAPVDPAPAGPAPVAPSRAAGVRHEYVLAVTGLGLLVVGLAVWGPLQRTAASEDTARTPGSVTAPPAAVQPREEPEAAAVATGGTSDDARIAPVGPTELVVQTEPEGAHVTVNGIGWGQSPVTLRHLEPGEKRVRVTMDGYAAAQLSVTIDEGSRETIHIRLPPLSPLGRPTL